MGLLSFFRDNLRFLSAGMLLTFITSFGQTFFISIFAGEIQAAYGLSHGDWGTIYFVGTMASGMLMIFAGGLADRFRVRALAMVVMVSLAALCLVMAGNGAVWLLPVLIFGLRFTGQGMLSHIAVVAMARWYVRARGKALSISVLGFSIGEALLPILFVSAMAGMNWRWLWVAAAGVTLVAMPVLLWLLRAERTPAAAADREDATGMNARHWVRREVLADWRFWGLIPIATSMSAFGTALFFQQVHLAEVKGWSHLQLVSMFPIFTVTALVAGLGTGVLIDRFGAVRLWWLAQLPMALGFLVLSIGNSVIWAGVAFLLAGMAQGANSTCTGAFWPEAYGTRHVGSVKALAAALMVAGSAVGPVLTGLLIDAGIGFPQQMPGIAAYMVAVSLWSGVVLRRVRRDLPQVA